MLIRQAQAHDAQTASKLVFSSASNLLPLMFDVNEGLNALGFLKHAMAQREGQFGFGNHWVIEKDEQIVAITSAWHCELSKAFHTATLQSITYYFGASHALEIIERCQILQEIFPAPQKNELCIGHFAVSALFQRQGIGTDLVAHMRKLALNRGKKALTLDVELTNQAANFFYRRSGFKKAQQQIVTQRLNGAEIGPYYHMVLSL